MKVDLYTKIVLTVIAGALLGILFQPYISTQPVNASTGTVQKVDIVQVNGRKLIDTVPVDVRKLNNHLLYRNVLPVEVKD